MRGGMARFSIALDRPVIGLGASAYLHYAALAPLIGNECRIAEHADVANALGAVVGQVRMSAEARVSQPEIGLFRVNSGEKLNDYDTEEEAMTAAEIHIRALAAGLAGDAITVVADPGAAVDALRGELVPGDVVLVKASRGIELEHVVDGLVAALGGLEPAR